jgi:hypothetical protein
MRLLAFILALFFVVLAVFDGFEEEDDIEYFGEFVTEAEFDFVDFPTSISRPTGSSKVNKSERIPIIKFFDGIINIFTREVVHVKTPFILLPKIYSDYSYLIANTVLANAP